jgi:molecular chaperone Hsp33
MKTLRDDLRGTIAPAAGLVGAILIGSYCKAGERINLNIQGSKLYRQALVDAYPDGTVRGYLVERESEAVHLVDGTEMGPWGSGMLSVLRTKSEEGKQPYIGTVPLVTGHLAKDLTFYWYQSEQLPSAVGLVVNLEKNGQVSSAGAFLVQVLPGASPAEVAAIEHHIKDMESLAQRIASDGDPLHLLSQIFQDTSFVVLEEKPLEMRCQCSWERVNRALALIGASELEAMLAEDNEAKVRCDFCAKEYKMGAEDLKKLIAAARS